MVLPDPGADCYHGTETPPHSDSIKGTSAQMKRANLHTQSTYLQKLTMVSNNKSSSQQWHSTAIQITNDNIQRRFQHRVKMAPPPQSFWTDEVVENSPPPPSAPGLMYPLPFSAPGFEYKKDTSSPTIVSSNNSLGDQHWHSTAIHITNDDTQQRLMMSPLSASLDRRVDQR